MPRRDPLNPSRCADPLAALAAPERLKLVRLLNASHHLNVLKSANLIRGTKSGRFVIDWPCDGLLNEIVAAEGPADCLDLGCCQIVVSPNMSLLRVPRGSRQIRQFALAMNATNPNERKADPAAVHTPASSIRQVMKSSPTRLVLTRHFGPGNSEQAGSLFTSFGSAKCRERCQAEKSTVVYICELFCYSRSELSGKSA